jgi:two-component system chemotaxis response regulator CheY
MKRCLIVDDAEAIRKVARCFIERLDYEVVEAESGQDALEICKRRMPDLIVLDWITPGMTALELLTALRLHGGDKRPFVLYCTTENDPADISRAFSAGADDYLIKPFDRESLTAKFTAAGLAA